MQRGHPFETSDQKVKNIKEAILAVDYIENNCNYDSIEAAKLIEYHTLNLKG